MSRDAGQDLPDVSFVIPVRPGEACTPALRSIQRSSYPAEKIEVLVIEGSNPSKQRNLAFAGVKGEIIYLVDDDTVLDPDALHNAVDHLQSGKRNEGKAVVGGPVLNHREATQFQKSIGLAYASRFGLGPFRLRYSRSGCVRRVAGEALISSNLAFTRNVLGCEARFDERLFGNEENDWLNRLQGASVALFYHPDMVGRKRHSPTFTRLAKQNFHYGRGRARHTIVNPRALRFILLLPIGFVGVLVAAVANPTPFGLMPVGLYALVDIVVSATLARRISPVSKTFLNLVAIFPAMHVAYGAGLMAGTLKWLVSRHARRSSPGDLGVIGNVKKLKKLVAGWQEQGD